MGFKLYLEEDFDSKNEIPKKPRQAPDKWMKASLRWAKGIKVFTWLTLIFYIINSASAIFFVSLGIWAKIELNISIIVLIVIFVVMWLGTLISIFRYNKGIEKYVFEVIKHDYVDSISDMDLILEMVFTSPLIWFFVVYFFSLLRVRVTVAILSYGIGIAVFPLIVLHFLVIVYALRISGYASVGASCATKAEIMNKQQNKELRKNEKMVREQKDKAEKLLNEVGSKFFVKYYYRLKRMSIVDIMDIIEENYSEQTKKQRIQKAKSIFEQELNIVALQLILSQNDGSVEENVKSEATTILQKEKQ